MQSSQSNYSVVIELGNPKDVKLELMKIIAQVISTRYKTQKEAASVLNIDQPKVSQINRLKIEGFSLKYLIHLLAMLDHEVKIKIQENLELHPLELV